MSSGCVLVTGATRGLGAAIAARLAADNWQVVINYAHNTKAAAEVAARIEAAGHTAILSKFDVTDEVEVARGLRDVREQFGAISIIVNNATGPQPTIPLAEQTWQDHLDQLSFFVKAPLILLQAVLPDMRETGYGRVINVGSEVAALGNPEFGHYVAAKAAMHGLTRSWARELGPDGITVNTVEPGWIKVERHSDVDEKEFAEYTAGVLLNHLGAPADIAAIVSFLASPEAGFITGQRFAVNGGKTMT